jgi:hypothetical protein
MKAWARAVTGLMLLLPAPHALPGQSEGSEAEQIQVAAFRHFAIKPCDISKPIYAGGCLLSIKRGRVSDYVLDQLREVAHVGRSEPSDFEVRNAVSVAFATKRALLLDILSTNRKTPDAVEVAVQSLSSPLGTTVCTGVVRRLPSGAWRLVSDDVRCTIS